MNYEYNILFPGVRWADRFDVWRLSSSSDTLVINFGHTVENTDQAIAVIKEHFGEDQIAAARQVTAMDLQLQVLSVELFNDPNVRAQLYEMKTRQDWIIEVLFANPQARQDALRYGLVQGEHSILPQSTTCATKEFTALGVRDMTLQDPQDALESFRELTQCALDRPVMKPTPAAGSVSANTVDNIKHIFLHADTEGIYDGSGTVILEGCYPRLAGPQGGIALRAMDRLGFVTVQVRRCFLYCENCRVLDDHEKEDCFEMMTEADYAIVQHAQEQPNQQQSEQSSTKSSSLPREQVGVLENSYQQLHSPLFMPLQEQQQHQQQQQSTSIPLAPNKAAAPAPENAEK